MYGLRKAVGISAMTNRKTSRSRIADGDQAPRSIAKMSLTTGGSSVKANQIENIHKQISQNQKTMQNMTQNLFTKNNAGSVPQGSSAAQSPQTM